MADSFSKKLATSLLSRMGLVAISRRHEALRYVEHPPRTVFDDALLRTFPSLHGLHFIQIGANDGHRLDPISTYLDRYDWHGLMFEPLPEHFAQLQHRRGGNPGLRLHCSAVGDSSGHRLIYDFAPAYTVNLPDWVHGLASFSHARLEQVANELSLPASAIRTTAVAMVTWEEVWRDFGPQPCDVLVLDTEGLDITLLRAADLAHHRPKLILFEHSCVSLDERLTFYRELLELGYTLACNREDTVAVLPLPPTP